MATFGRLLRELREARGLSLTRFAASTHYSKGYLSRVESGRQAASEALARQCDAALDARGDLIAAAHLDLVESRQARTPASAELLHRIRTGDLDAATVDAVQRTVIGLCCRYAHADAWSLAEEARGWLREIARLLRRPVGLARHRDLLVAAGWLALLVGCLEYDQGQRTAAEATRAAAAQLGIEAGASAIVGWAYELSAWFALTQGRYRDVLDAADAGLAGAGTDSVAVQLIGQQAKARARLGDLAGVRATLAMGEQRLATIQHPERRDNHFAIDADKWEFLAMDAYRLAGADAEAGRHATAVLAKGRDVDGRELSPMRSAEARLTLAIVAAREGELDRALALGTEAFAVDRRSLPSLLMVAGELDSELTRRWPTERTVTDYRALIQSIVR
jgi:transcriptional regulator with XRE-family HTH domain